MMPFDISINTDLRAFVKAVLKNEEASRQSGHPIVESYARCERAPRLHSLMRSAHKI